MVRPPLGCERRADDCLEKLQRLSKQQKSSEVGEQEDGRKYLFLGCGKE